MQSESLEQLRMLVFEGGFDEDSRRQVLGYERRLQKLAETEKARDIPVVREYMAYLEKEITRCETLLKADETLTDLQRAKLFAIIQVSEKYTHLFNGSAIRNLELAIKQALDAART